MSESPSPDAVAGRGAMIAARVLLALATLLTVVAIGTGAFGCLLGGILSDRIGRTTTTAGMMIASGACALAIGFAFGGPSWLFITILVIWGVPPGSHVPRHRCEGRRTGGIPHTSDAGVPHTSDRPP